jgi:glycerol-3-phosphate dehydrogenase (NAD(P)+)
MKTLGVLGAGSWGTALAVHFAGAGHRVTLWSRRPDLAETIARDGENREYLPGVPIPGRLTCTSRLQDLASCDPVLVVIPSHGFRSVVADFLAGCQGGGPLTLVSATKGIETESLARMSQVVAEEADGCSRVVEFGLLSGPTFAAELARNVPSAAVVASEVPGLGTRLRELLATPTLRLYSTRDVVGVELGGAAKNVIAVGAGILHGLGLGQNTQAALITRGLHEITRLGLACGGQRRTLSGLAGLGDLVLTCTGGLSRNRQTGVALAQGKSLAEIEAESSMVAEGVKNSLSLSRLATRLEIEMPITEQMRAVIYDGKSPRGALEELMARERKAESVL